MDPTTLGVIGGVSADGVTVTEGVYGDGLPFEVFRTGASPRGAVIFCSGWPDAGMTGIFKRPLRAWQSYRDWATLVARAGLAGILYGNREPADVHALVAHLRANAASLGLTQLGAWACSGHGPLALSVLSRDALACAALLYPYSIDAEAAAAQFQFAAPPVGDLRCPLLVVRAAQDAMPGLNAALDRFLAAHPAASRIDVDGPHAFDLVDDTPRHREVVAEVVAWLAAHLGSDLLTE